MKFKNIYKNYIECAVCFALSVVSIIGADSKKYGFILCAVFAVLGVLFIISAKLQRKNIETSKVTYLGEGCVQIVSSEDIVLYVNPNGAIDKEILLPADVVLFTKDLESDSVIDAIQKKEGCRILFPSTIIDFEDTDCEMLEHMRFVIERIGVCKEQKDRGTAGYMVKVDDVLLYFAPSANCFEGTEILKLKDIQFAFIPLNTEDKKALDDFAETAKHIDAMCTVPIKLGNGFVDLNSKQFKGISIAELEIGKVMEV